MVGQLGFEKARWKGAGCQRRTETWGISRDNRGASGIVSWWPSRCVSRIWCVTDQIECGSACYRCWSKIDRSDISLTTFPAAPLRKLCVALSIKSWLEQARS